MRTAIVATVYNRADLWAKTLESFEQYYDRDVIYISDPDPDPKDYVNPAIAYNRAFIEALKFDPDIIIIQNGECYHGGDIVGYAEKNLTDKNYISFGCYSLSKESPIPPVIKWDEGASYDGQSAWYNHSKFRPVGYHFCSAITAKNLKKINGFDERFKDGSGYDDDYFLCQIRNLGLKVEIVNDPYVYHQWHYSNKWGGELNKDLFDRLKTTADYRAVHLINPDL